ncbi:kielin/chordin-like protein [Nematostella vectensis]|uniref:kielin/chordin-like protein n=1 Tax=Nematostella vectensis TaxID=45351 RepID=UPI0013901177|nr:kielin/chordin-like protein [Nematostella vectensis]
MMLLLGNLVMPFLMLLGLSTSDLIETIDMFKETGLSIGSHQGVEVTNLNQSTNHSLAFHFGLMTTDVRATDTAVQRFRAAFDMTGIFAISAWVRLDFEEMFSRNTVVSLSSERGTKVLALFSVRTWMNNLEMDFTYESRDRLMTIRHESRNISAVFVWRHVAVRVDTKKQHVTFILDGKVTEVKPLKEKMETIPVEAELRLGQMLEAMSKGIGEITRRFKGSMADVKITFEGEEKAANSSVGEIIPSTKNCTNGTLWEKDNGTVCECRNGLIVCIDNCTCRDNGTVYHNGDRWKHSNNTCITCHCQAGKIICSPKKCAKLNCSGASRPVTLPGQCCPMCLEPEGCSAITCRKPNCTGLSGRVVKLKEKCCPVCEEHQCRGTDKLYSSCGTMCPWTCTNLYDDDECPEECNRGCFCPRGMVVDRNGKCVLATRCGCKYEGKMFLAGQEYLPVSCIKCKCMSGRMQCRKVCDVYKRGLATHKFGP